MHTYTEFCLMYWIALVHMLAFPSLTIEFADVILLSIWMKMHCTFMTQQIILCSMHSNMYTTFMLLLLPPYLNFNASQYGARLFTQKRVSIPFQVYIFSNSLTSIWFFEIFRHRLYSTIQKKKANFVAIGTSKSKYSIAWRCV